MLVCCVCNETATTEIYTYGPTLAHHDALPICRTGAAGADRAGAWRRRCARRGRDDAELSAVGLCPRGVRRAVDVAVADALAPRRGGAADDRRSEEHTSELQSLMRISYAVFCLKKKITKTT